MRFYLWLCLSFIFCFSCSRPAKEIAFPSSNSLRITWEVLNDALENDDRRTNKFSITNQSDTAFPHQGWSLYFNQFPHAIYIDPSQEMVFEIEHVNGDLYRIEPGDSFPIIGPNETVAISYKSHWPLVKKTHGPKGPFFVVGRDTRNERVVAITNFEILDFPRDIEYNSIKGNLPAYLTAEDRFDLYDEVKELPLAHANRITPTPFKLVSSGAMTLIRSNMKILFDQGLEREADQLATLLNQVLENPNAGQDTGQIYLRQSALNINGLTEEVYRLNIKQDGEIEIVGSDPAGVYYGIQTLKALLPPDVFTGSQDSIPIPVLSIEDAPRFVYRGLHLDVARNFQDFEEVRRLLQLMGFYKLNRLHLHLTDDEGWRLEIPGLPELTHVGGRRGWSTASEKVLPPAYGSGGLADAEGNAGTGFFTRDQYIQLLKYASTHHIQVIPEINGPGHARAAIESMKVRHDRLMNQGSSDEAVQYLLHDPNDSSRYSSAQNYNDNVICVCRESTYRFFEKVIEEVVSMYREAEVPLPMINGGGDEVPNGAWEGSPLCDNLINDGSGPSSIDELYAYFFKRYNQIVANYDLRLGGWEEIAMGTLETADGPIHAPDPSLLDERYIAYAWNSIIGGGGEDIAYRLANLGFDVVMCNASNLYFDMAYHYEPDEPGLFWAGFVDTKNAFETSPFNLFASVYQDDIGRPLDGFELARSKVLLNPGSRANILGIQGQLWSETILTTNALEYLLLPKLLALSERAWSVPPPWESASNLSQAKSTITSSWNRFANRIGQIELPRLDHMQSGFHYRIPPPGAKVIANKLTANIAFPGLEIRYTTDGSEPTPYSNVYTKPFDVNQGQTIRLRTFTRAQRASRETQLQVPLIN